MRLQITGIGHYIIFSMLGEKRTHTHTHTKENYEGKEIINPTTPSIRSSY